MSDDHDSAEEKAAHHAGETDALVDAFAGMVHELRTPLVGVMGGCDLLESTPLQAQQRRYLSMVRASATALLGRVNNLLDLRRAEHTDAPLAEEPFYLYETLESVFDVVAEMAMREGCSLTYEVALETPTYLIGDEGRLHQVLLNLVGNAVRYAPETPIVVRASAEPQDDGVAMTLHVDDGGRGIAEDERDLLFTPFWQRPGGKAANSSGLGLAVSSLVATQLGGTLEVGEAPEGGARLSLRVPFQVQEHPERRTLALPLPLIDGCVSIVVGDDALRGQLVDLVTGLGARVNERDPSQLAKEASPPSPGQTGPCALVITDDDACHAAAADQSTPCILVRKPGDNSAPSHSDWLLIAPVRRLDLAESMRGAVLGTAPRAALSTLQTLSGRRVLLVDDAHENRELIAGLLERWGYVVVQASTGAEALERYSEGRYAAVLLDINLGAGESGEVVMSELRAADAGRTNPTPIAALTAEVRKADVERLLEVGFDAHIPKPVTRQELRAALRRLWEPLTARTGGDLSHAGSTSPSASGDERSGKALPAELGELRMLLLASDWDGLEDAVAALQGGPWAGRLDAVRRAVRERDRVQLQQALDKMAEEAPAQEPRRAAGSVEDELFIDEEDAALLDDLRPLFVSARIKDRAHLRMAQTEGSVDGVGPIAHRIMGSAALYGFSALGKAARALHRAVSEGDRATVEQGLEKVITLIDEMLRSADEPRDTRD